MSDASWLFMANAFFWTGIGIYCAWLGIRQHKLRQEIKHLEILRNDEHK